MKQRLLFLGPPGAGKGTQAQLISSKQGLVHLSTGDLLRSEVQAASTLGKAVETIMNRGELVSDDLVLAIVESQLKQTSSGWLLDGFPRTVAQAESLEVLLASLAQPIERVVLLELNDEALITRLLSRGRPDDTEAVIRNRLEVYREKTLPLIDFYRKKDILSAVAAHGSIEEITARIGEVLN